LHARLSFPGPGLHSRLAPCPSTPNCVSSLASDPAHAMLPIPFTIRAPAVLDLILIVLAAEPGARVVLRDSEYLRAEFRSRFLRLVDDVEFLLDADAKLVHFRSAARGRRPDFGANRRRMTRLRELIADEVAPRET
jgi:uncharacterized protein (DUF1499 family)